MLDYVRFEPVNRYTATLVDSQQDDIQQGPLKDYINSQAMKVTTPSGHILCKVPCLGHGWSSLYQKLSLSIGSSDEGTEFS